jgi:hypothetical protein
MSGLCKGKKLIHRKKGLSFFDQEVIIQKERTLSIGFLYSGEAALALIVRLLLALKIVRKSLFNSPSFF